MKKQSCILAISLLIVLFSGCKKSEGSKIKNFFGASPEISELSITKERPDFLCLTAVELCCVDPPACTCCCQPDQITRDEASLDRVTVSARVTDPTVPNNADILVVVAHFLDPPPSTGISQINQISLQMFDDGSVTLGTTAAGAQIASGDVQAGDGVFTRKFYFASTTNESNSCQETQDQSEMNHTFSTYSTTASITTTLDFIFSIQAIDKSGNIDTSSNVTLAIQAAFRTSGATDQRDCGAPTGLGGCLPGTP